MAFRKTVFAALLASACTFTVGAALAQDGSGSFLAARQAMIDRNYAVAADYFQRAIARNPERLDLLENGMVAFAALGDMARAVALAERLHDRDPDGGLAALVLMSASIAAGDFDRAETLIDISPRFSPLLDGLMRGWIHLGQGRMSDAVAQFDGMTQNPTLEMFGQYHKALALAAVGDFGGADAIMSAADGGTLRLTRGSLLAHVEIMMQIDQRDRALALLDDLLAGSTDAELTDLRNRVLAGEDIEYRFVTRAEEGAAKVFYTIASALSGEGDDRFGLLYARLAQFLRPDDTEAILLLAAILDSQDQHELSIEAYALVPPAHLSYPQAVAGKAQALHALEREDEAVEVLRALVASFPESLSAHVSLADMLRRLSRFEEAAEAYDAAIALIEEPLPNHWFLFYARGIAHERSDNWPPAEADFRFALELHPDQPLVLNYLGYSLVEQRRNLEEAEDMIRRAVAARPDDGYITDSLGWVLYRMGRFEEAVEPMERAVELLPQDPIVNDHLGDVYWKVGRKREAVFQWRRALYFGPEPDEEKRIRRKLEVGLDQVLREEAEAGDAD